MAQRGSMASAGSAIVGSTRDGTVISWNAAAERIFGHRSDEAIGRSVAPLVCGDHQAEFAEAFERVKQGEDIGDLDTCHRHKDGRSIDVSMTLFPVRDPGGMLIGNAVIARDISHYKRTERALHDSERRFREVAEQIREVLWITSADGRKVLFVSRMYEQLWGRTREQLYDDPNEWLDAIHPADRGRVTDAWFSGDGIRKTLAMVYRVVRPGGDIRWARDRRFPVYDDDTGCIRCIAGLTEDITARRRNEMQMQHDRTQLRALAAELVLAEDRERRRLAADLHDSLDQNLTLARIKLVELHRSLRTSFLGPTLRVTRTLIEESLRSVRSMTFELSPPVLHDLGFVPAVQWLADDMHARYELRVRLEDDGQPKPMDERIRVMLFRSLRELLVNVAKHADTPDATVLLRLDGSAISITVRDDGAGFDTDGVLRHSREGAFGLFSIRQRLVHMGGHMEVESAVGRGTTVVLTAPLLQEPATAADVAT